jgi:hypothetical protein
MCDRAKGLNRSAHGGLRTRIIGKCPDMNCMDLGVLRHATFEVDAQVRQWIEEAERSALDAIDEHALLIKEPVHELVMQRSLALKELDLLMVQERIMVGSTI